MSMQIPLNHVNPYVRRIYTVEIERHSTSEFLIGYCNRMLYIRDGHGFLQNPAGYLSLRPGTLAIICAGEQHNIISYPDERLSALCFDFDCTQLFSGKPQAPSPVSAQKFDARVSYDTTRPKDIPPSKGCLCINNMQSLAPALQWMAELYEGNSSYLSALLSGHFKVLLCEFFASLNPDKPSMALTPRQLILEVFTYLDLYYMDDISNKDIASHINYHPNYINKQMVQYTGKSLHQHLIAYRVARALELLLFTTAPIQDIARSTGFKTVQYFSKTFMRNVGMPPSSVRLLYKNSAEYVSRSFKSIAQTR